MAEEKIGSALYTDFLVQRRIGDFDACKYLGAVQHEYLRPKKVQFVTINGEQIFVSRIVVNAQKLHENIMLGHENAKKDIEKYQNLYREGTLSAAAMDRACEDIILPGLRYCLECLRYCADKLKLTQSAFLPLAQEVDKTYPKLLEYSDHAYDVYCSKLSVAEQNAQRYKEALDRRTAAVIASAPKTLHIRGRFEEGIFGDTFHGTAHVTSAMTQADVIQAYIGNESAANVNRQINAAQIQKRTVNVLAEYVQEELLRFRDRVLTVLSECAPAGLIHRPALISDSVTARPYLKKNVRKLLDSIESEDYLKLKILIERFQIPFEQWFEKDICQDVLDDYIHTGRYNYPYDDFYFTLYLRGVRFPADYPMIHSLFMEHFKDKIRKKAAALLADKKLRVPKNATVDDYFKEIFDEADESEMLKSTYEEDAELRVVAQEQLDILKKERSPRFFGW